MGEDTHTKNDRTDSPSNLAEEANSDSKDMVAKKSIAARTHSKKRSESHTKSPTVVKVQSRTRKYLAICGGGLAIMAIVTSGFFSQYYKNRALPNVYVAGVNVSRQTADQIKDVIAQKQSGMKIELQTKSHTFNPKLDEVGYGVELDETVIDVLAAKRSSIWARLAFWNKSQNMVKVTVNDNLLSQYVETHIPELITPPVDATLKFDENSGAFTVTDQAGGKGADLISLKAGLVLSGQTLEPVTLNVKTAPKGPNISETELTPLIDAADELVSRRVTLTGRGNTYTARTSDIATWVTPTPRDDGTVRLVIDPAKIQSYVEGIGKRISSPPLDTKVIRDETTGTEVVLQAGRDGTELADKQTLANAIANSLADGKDVDEVMNIKVATHKVVNMSTYDKWIEIDLSEQKTTAYERTTPVNSFIIASGTQGHETVKGEFSIWLRVRTQTMRGGSKADGSYYSIPNVEWVSYFYEDYALHGAWWRNVFGRPASHGCVNMTNEDARWVYEWAPVGTKVIVHD